MKENEEEQYNQLVKAIDTSLGKKDGIINCADILKTLHANGFYIESDH